MLAQGTKAQESSHMLEQLRTALPVMGPPMAVAGAIMLVAWWPRARRLQVPGEGGGRAHSDEAVLPGAARVGPAGHRGLASALALGLAFASAFVIVIGGMPPLPLVERWHWLACMCIGATITGALAGASARSPAAVGLSGFVTAAAGAFLFQPLASVAHPHIMRGGVGVLILITWWCLDRSARSHRGFATPLLLAIMFAGISLVTLHGHDVNFALLAASVTAALGAVAVLALFLPPMSLANGGTHVLATLFGGLLAIVWMYERGHIVALTLIAITPVMLRIVEIATARLTTPWLRTAARIATVILLLGAALVTTMLTTDNQ